MTNGTTGRATSWEELEYFTEDEFRCSHCGENGMELEFVAELDEIRGALGFPLMVSSGYRCPEHPIEAAKDQPGPHSTGRAADILVAGGQARDFLKRAVQVFPGIGVNQKGEWDQRFIHVDQLGYRVWTY